MEFVNLTPHTINIVDGEGNEVLSVSPSGEIARVAVSNQLVETVLGIEIYRAEYGQIEGLPAPQADTVYIVSMLVRERVPERSDVMSPGQLVRDDSGRPVGCRGLVMN
jgi:hypothetical protein